MSVQKLRMKYHPAKKEVAFQRFENGREIPIKKDSDLKKSKIREDNSSFKIVATLFLKLLR